MTYTVQVTAQENNITVVTTSSPTINVTETTGGSFTITQQVSSVGVTQQISTVTVNLDAIELYLDDLNTFWKGEWVSETSTYIHGDLVTYQSNMYLLGQYSMDGSAYYPPSSTPPPNDSNWKLFVWHDAPFYQQLVTEAGVNATLGGDLSVAGNTTLNNLQVNNTTHLVGSLIMDTPLDHLTVTNHLSAGSISVGALDGNGLYIASTSTFVGRATFQGGIDVTGTSSFQTSKFLGPVEFDSTATFLGAVDMHLADVEVHNLTVDNQFNIGGLNYPKGKGLPYYALITNGVNQADWAPLGTAIIWELNNDLITAGFDIISGSPEQRLRIGTSDAVTEGNRNPNPLNYTDYEQTGITVNSNGYLTLVSANTLTLTNNVSSSTGISILNNNVAITSWATATLYSLTDDVHIRSGINNIYYPYSNIVLDTQGGGTTASHGLVVIPHGGIKFPDGTIQNTAGSGGGGGQTYSFSSSEGINITESSGGNNTNVYIYGQIASQSQLGQVRAGGTVTNIVIAADGTISAIGAGFYTLPVATASTLGGVKVQDGTGIPFSGGVVIYGEQLYLAVASATQLGGIKVGSNLSIDNEGVLSANAGLINTATWSLNADAYTNGYKIANNTGEANYATISDTGILAHAQGNVETFSSGTTTVISQGDITITNEYSGSGTVPNVNIVSTASGNVNISGGATGNANISGLETYLSATFGNNISGQNVTVEASENINLNPSGVVRIGADAAHSTLEVSQIYNRAGNYAPFFPAGVQYPDSTVQITAYQSNQIPLPPPVNVVANWPYINNATDINNALSSVGISTATLFMGIFAEDTSHTWVYTAYGPLIGWEDINA